MKKKKNCLSTLAIFFDVIVANMAAIFSKAALSSLAASSCFQGGKLGSAFTSAYTKAYTKYYNTTQEVFTLNILSKLTNWWDLPLWLSSSILPT